MHILSRPSQSFPMIVLLVLVAFEGCRSDQPAPAGNAETTAAGNAGTTAVVQVPESNPPVLTKEVADRIREGMAQEEVLSILRDAGRPSPSAGSLLENVYDQGKLNTLRYDLTVEQGKRKLVLAFKSGKLEGKTVEGID